MASSEAEEALRRSMALINQARSELEMPKAFHNSAVFTTVVGNPKWGTREFTAHEALLAAESSYYKTMINAGFSETSNRKIILNDVQPLVVDMFHQWLYSRDMKLSLATGCAHDDETSTGKRLRLEGCEGSIDAVPEDTYDLSDIQLVLIALVQAYTFALYVEAPNFQRYCLLCFRHSLEGAWAVGMTTMLRVADHLCSNTLDTESTDQSEDPARTFLSLYVVSRMRNHRIGNPFWRSWSMDELEDLSNTDSRRFIRDVVKFSVACLSLDNAQLEAEDEKWDREPCPWCKRV